MSYYRPIAGLGAVPRLVLPSQKISTTTVRQEDGMELPAVAPVSLPPDSMLPPASISSGGFPWMLPAVGLVAVGGFLLWRRHKKKQQKGATP